MTNYPFSELFLHWNALAYYSELDWANTIEYFLTPRNPSDLITDATWKIMKIITVTATWAFEAGKSVTRAGGSPDFTFTATDLATVKAYTYL